MDYSSLIAVALASLIDSFITAWVFAIIFQSKKKLELQKVQINLLHKIAERSGVGNEELDQILIKVRIGYTFKDT